MFVVHITSSYKCLHICLEMFILTLQVLTTTADDIFMIFFFSEKIRLDLLCESFARQTIHMRCLVLFTLRNTKNQNGICCTCDEH